MVPAIPGRHLTDPDHRSVAVAIAAGYALLIAALFRSPVEGIAAATATPASALFFFVFPAGGLLSAAYVARDWPLAVAVAFASGSYLAVAGIAVALVPNGGKVALTAVGLALFALGVFALTEALQSVAATLVPEGAFA
jgi:hypothetical protein